MDIETAVRSRIRRYGDRGGTEKTMNLFLNLFGMKHPKVREHLERVALLSEGVACFLKKDRKAAFLAGFFHDTGKIVLPPHLFEENYSINGQEYETIKNHANAGYEILKNIHLFTALCAGLHHAVYRSGYGIKKEDIPGEMSLETMKKILEIATIVSICDFIDAFTHRKTRIMDGSNDKSQNLEGMLKEKYPNDHNMVKIALEINKKLGL